MDRRHHVRLRDQRGRLRRRHHRGRHERGGTLQDTWQADGNGNITTYTYNADGNATSVTAPDGIGRRPRRPPPGTTAAGSRPAQRPPEAATPCSSSQTGPQEKSRRGITRRSPRRRRRRRPGKPGPCTTPTGTSCTPPPASTSQARHGRLLADHLSAVQRQQRHAAGASTAISCAATPPSPSLPCATINADGVVTQLAYDSAGRPDLHAPPRTASGGRARDHHLRLRR